MQLNNVHFSEVDGALVFEHQGVNYLYAGRKNGMMHGVVQDKGGVWAELLDPAEVREYDEVLETAKKRHLKVVTFDVTFLQISVRKENAATVDSHDELDDVQRVSQTDCRTPDGITIGLIDGMLAMARVLRKGDLSAPDVQEALRGLQTDEDMKFLMYSATLIPMSQYDADWEFGDEQKPVVPADKPAPVTPAAVVQAKAPEPDGLPTSCGTEWGGPEGSFFMTVSRYSTWPKGWSDHVSTCYFNSHIDVDAYLLDQAKWAMLEDNEVKINVFRRDACNSIESLHYKWQDYVGKPIGHVPAIRSVEW